jgi:hypothetical protein
MDFAADLSLFYVDFGIDAQVSGQTDPVRGLFDANYADALGIAGTRPVFRAARTAPIQRGDQLTIKGVAYRVKTGEPHGESEMIWPLETI